MNTLRSSSQTMFHAHPDKCTLQPPRPPLDPVCVCLECRLVGGDGVVPAAQANVDVARHVHQVAHGGVGVTQGQAVCCCLTKGWGAGRQGVGGKERGCSMCEVTCLPAGEGSRAGRCSWSVPVLRLQLGLRLLFTQAAEGG